jgi:hypothetical protein
MAGKLITLPLRASLRSAQLLTRAAGGAARRMLSITGHAPASHDEPVERAVSPADIEDRTAPRAPAAKPPTVLPPAFEARTPISAEPAHVTEEPVLVAESAEPGAEKGAGARITVIEPWTGYGRMNARDVIDRVRTASVAELAALRLYEARHRARRTVLAAVDRQLKLAAGGRPA